MSEDCWYRNHFCSEFNISQTSFLTENLKNFLSNSQKQESLQFILIDSRRSWSFAPVKS